MAIGFLRNFGTDQPREAICLLVLSAINFANSLDTDRGPGSKLFAARGIWNLYRICAHADVFGGARGLHFALMLQLHPHVVYAIREDFCESVHIISYWHRVGDNRKRS